MSLSVLFSLFYSAGNIAEGGNKWCGEHYATSCDKCGGDGQDEETCSGGTRPDGRVNHWNFVSCENESSIINCGDCGLGYIGYIGSGPKTWSCIAMNPATFIDFDEDPPVDATACFGVFCASASVEG